MQKHGHDRQQDHGGYAYPQKSHSSHTEQLGKNLSEILSIEQDQTNRRITDGQKDDHVEEIKIACRRNRRHCNEKIRTLVSDDLFDSQNQKREPDHWVQKIRVPRRIQDSPVAETVGERPRQDGFPVCSARTETQGRKSDPGKIESQKAGK